MEIASHIIGAIHVNSYTYNDVAVVIPKGIN